MRLFSCFFPHLFPPALSELRGLGFGVRAFGFSVFFPPTLGLGFFLI